MSQINNQKNLKKSVSKKRIGILWGLTGTILVSLVIVLVALASQSQLVDNQNVKWNYKYTPEFAKESLGHKYTNLEPKDINVTDGVRKDYNPIADVVTLEDLLFHQNAQTIYDLSAVKQNFISFKNNNVQVYQLDKWGPAPSTQSAKTAQNIQAGIALLFVTSLIVAIFTTVIVAVKTKKRQGANYE